MFQGTDRNHYLVEYLTPVLVQYQLLWEFCIHLYMDLTPLHSEYWPLQAIVAHILHSHARH